MNELSSWDIEENGVKPTLFTTHAASRAISTGLAQVAWVCHLPATGLSANLVKSVGVTPFL